MFVSTASYVHPAMAEDGDAVRHESRPGPQVYEHCVVWNNCSGSFRREHSHYKECKKCGRMVWIPRRNWKKLKASLWCDCTLGADLRAEHRACTV
jgi:hypothetical protein